MERDLARRGLLPGQQAAPHTAHGDQLRAARRYAAAGAPVGLEQALIIKGHMTSPAMRPTHPAPRRRARGAGAHGGSRVILRHHRSKPAPTGRTRPDTTQRRPGKPTETSVPGAVEAGSDPLRQRAVVGSLPLVRRVAPVVAVDPGRGLHRCQQDRVVSRPSPFPEHPCSL